MLLPVGQNGLRLGGADAGQPVQVIGVGGVQVDDLVGGASSRAGSGAEGSCGADTVTV